MCWLELLVLSYVIKKKSSKGHVLVWLGLGRLPALLQVLGVGGSLLLEDYHAIPPKVVKPSKLFLCKGTISGQAVMMHSLLLILSKG